MICAVYKSLRKAESYLFVEKRNDFERVPEALLAMFGEPQLVMMLPIDKRDHLGFADITKVRAELKEKGFYLQLPPPVVNLLEQHKKDIGYNPE
ncbi:YcgL domain-containing protein [Shewanella fidelis]|uniref:YcgL domain-containing protein OS133_10605 n=1 Tax=Shewanella fidelis TaxID=173509 RepID=A0AAW8NLJ8_9GAMM|nr:YcgL domain-containing protein [Shewanella fidelis]MDR8524108.1 YcgL domain-containing protein [Shewanella fidelis]MDW4810655.1 YcgL domain-containing protein [Shewanella fidelis]MDW4814776.1 YcgL domain-containing protein [Shewanella fidelis]MDW4818866.1 YcgL domain-containing protein [Shewanella fidelis]MDW4823457.1 YcgL domain-containing protein [Shewanella fidelis]